MYLLRHAQTISHGNNGGVAISVILIEMRIGAGGGSGMALVRGGVELIDMLKMGSNKLRFQAFYVDDEAPLALRPMEWGTCFCNIDFILKRGILPGKATE